MSSVDLRDFLAGYLAETDEHLASATGQLEALQRAARAGQPQPQAARALFRALHTIKGLSAMVGVEPVAEIAHAMETLLAACERAGGVTPTRALDLLGDGLNAIHARVRSLANDQPVAPAPRTLVDALGSIEMTEAAPAGEAALTLDDELGEKLGPADKQQIAAGLRAGRRAVRIDFSPSTARAAAGCNITSVRERVGVLGEIVKVVPLTRSEEPDTPTGLLFALVVVTDASSEQLADAACMPVSAVHDIGAPRPPSLTPDTIEEAVDSAPSRTSVVRVPVARLDDALEKLSAVVVDRFRLQRAVRALAERGADVRELEDVLAESGRQLRDLRAAILRARTVSVAEMLERMPLLVRGLARSTGKQVRLEMHVGRAELDKAVAERLFPAIVHLVRNAVDHGVESPSRRREAGKPEEAVVGIHCEELTQERLELTVSDDGGGIDVRTLAARAGRSVPSTDEELLSLLAAPGVSSRAEAGPTSGRGMGVDIVRRIVVDQLGGELLVRTQPGVGTKFVVRVPLTITIIDAFSFECSGQTFVVPVSIVDEIIDVDADLVTLPPLARPGDARILARRGEPVALVGLAAALDLPNSHTVGHKAIVVRRGTQAFAFEVEKLVGKQEVVVRPLDDALVKTPAVAGTVDLGDGRPTLLLDLCSIGARLSRAMEARP